MSVAWEDTMSSSSEIVSQLHFFYFHIPVERQVEVGTHKVEESRERSRWIPKEVRVHDAAEAFNGKCMSIDIYELDR
jgi:hypothetical protein